MNKAKYIIDILYSFEKAVALMAFAVMTLVIIADVVSRKMLGQGIAGAPRIAVYAMIIAAFISFGLASHKGRHLRPRFADNWLPERWSHGVMRLQEALMAVFCLVCTATTIIVVYDTYLLQETSRMLRIVIWPMQTVMPLAFFIGAIRHGCFTLYPEIRPHEGQKNKEMQNQGSQNGGSSS